ncbi:MAG: hypothetical protein LBK99_26445 [Opitutaceae bacterium]|nr:hypothetical protein [Opitutaceae bacterium]
MRSRISTLPRQATRVACLLFCAAALLTALPSPALRAQPRDNLPPPPYSSITPPDQAEGRKILQAFRGKGIAAPYYFDFALRVLPRRGAERLISGRLRGDRNAHGPISRISVTLPDGAEERLLVQGGPFPQAWTWRTGQGTAGTPVGTDALFEPVAGTHLTAFDLQMQFLYWNDFTFEGVTRLKSRPAHVFFLRPPPEIAALQPALKGMRVYLDTQFGALVQAEYVGGNNKTTKVMSLVELKKIGDQYIPKTFDLRDEATRDKTRFLVTAAALSQDFLPPIFEPGALGDPLQPPPASQLVRIKP